MMSEVTVKQSVVNEIEKKCWVYRCRAQEAIKSSEKRYRTALYRKHGVDFSGATMIVVEDK